MKDWQSIVAAAIVTSTAALASHTTYAQDAGVMGFLPGQNLEQVMSLVKSQNIECKSWDIDVPKVCMDHTTHNQLTFYWTWTVRPRALRSAHLSFRSKAMPNQVADGLAKRYHTDYSVVGLYREFDWQLTDTTRLSLAKAADDEYILDITDSAIERNELAK
jgi:hypothetical protein